MGSVLRLMQITKATALLAFDEYALSPTKSQLDIGHTCLMLSQGTLQPDQHLGPDKGCHYQKEFPPVLVKSYSLIQSQLTKKIRSANQSLEHRGRCLEKFRPVILIFMSLANQNHFFIKAWYYVYFLNIIWSILIILRI